MVNKQKSLHRPITHNEYTFMSEAAKKVGIINKVKKEITHIDYQINEVNANNRGFYKNIEENFIVLATAKYSIPFMLGGVFLVLGIAFLTIILTVEADTSDPETGITIATVVFFLGFLFFLIYGLTMPAKDFIYNRLKSTVTFPGFMWHKNITMHISVLEFSYTQPSAQGLGAYMLTIIRPDKMFSGYTMSTGRKYDKDISFFLWYMDKNRPLPPGDALDKYRDNDFKRRKAEGFPKPIFPSLVETPEFTPEQQAERLMIGGW